MYNICPKCRKPITIDDPFCPHCGKRLRKSPKTQTTPRIRTLLKNKKVRFGLVAAAAIVLLAAVFFIGLGIGEGRGYHYNDAADGTPVPDNTTVYVTPSGKKYHVLQICPAIKNKNIKSLSLADALSEGYDPCKICSAQNGDSD